MSNKLFVLVIILMFFVAFIVVSVDKDETPREKLSQMLPLGDRSTPTVEVSASESRKYEENEFVTVASLELHGKDKELLFKQLTSRRASIFEQMKSLDVTESDIEQNTVEMRKEWSYDKGTRSLTGYVVSQLFAIRSSNRSTAAAVIAALSAELDVEINQTTASLRDKDSLKKEAIRAVGKKALEKAENYAESVGGKLGKVIAVNGDQYGDGVSFRVLSARKAMDYASAEDFASMSSVADSVEISASIHLVAELLQ